MSSDDFNASALKGQRGLGRIARAAGYSVAGLRAAFRGEAAFRQLVLLNALLVPLAFALDVTRAERALLVMACLLTLIVELFNSAIEAAIDRISVERHPLSKAAKDMGSAAQLLALAALASVWGIVLL